MGLIELIVLHYRPHSLDKEVAKLWLKTLHPLGKQLVDIGLIIMGNDQKEAEQI